MQKLHNFLLALENIQFGEIKIEIDGDKTYHFKAKDSPSKQEDIFALSYKSTDGNNSNNPNSTNHPNHPPFSISKLNAHLFIKDLSMIDDCLIGGDVGFGESYFNQKWYSDNLADLLLFFAVNNKSLEQFFHANRFKTALMLIGAYFRKNSKKGSKKNISYHYDLGNEFYKLWLDQSKTYSSAVFENYHQSLEVAQANKYQRIINKIKPNSNILEIGCGWGGFAKMANNNNHNLTCLTLSSEQANFLNQFIANNNLQDKISLKICDYRDENAIYDYVVSIEMFEAVGRQYWNNYFSKVSNCLKDNGEAIIQTITIDENFFDDYQKRVDFIQKYIFPGGVLPSKSIFRTLADNNKLKVEEEFSFGFSYYQTLKIWLQNFDNATDKIMTLGFNREFILKWRFYLAYCMAGFGSKRIDVVQFYLRKQ
jgi:cyclopropane-fatty-acyl-phospholipid synthase